MTRHAHKPVSKPAAHPVPASAKLLGTAEVGQSAALLFINTDYHEMLLRLPIASAANPAELLMHLEQNGWSYDRARELYTKPLIDGPAVSELQEKRFFSQMATTFLSTTSLALY